MKYLINIFILLILINSNVNGIDVKKYLSEKLKNYNKIDYVIVSPKNADLSNCAIDNSRELIIARDLAYLPIIISKNGEVKHSLVTLKVKLYKSVLVSTRSLRKNEYLNPADFKVLNKEVSQLRFEPTEKSLNFNKYKVRLKILENTILQNSMIQRIPEIESGDRIEAVYNSNALNIRFKATARSEGMAGDIIRIKRDDKRIFKARVINNTTVKIIE